MRSENQTCTWDMRQTFYFLVWGAYLITLSLLYGDGVTHGMAAGMLV